MGSTKCLSTGWMPALVSFAASSASAAEQAQPQPYAWPAWQAMPWTGWMGWGGWNTTPWPAFGWIFMLGCFVLMAIACWLMMRRGGIGCCRWAGTIGRGDALRRRAGGRAATALDLLDERYVSGEIDEREYAHMKAVLAAPPSSSSSPPSPPPNSRASTAGKMPAESLPSSSKPRPSRT